MHECERCGATKDAERVNLGDVRLTHLCDECRNDWTEIVLAAAKEFLAGGTEPTLEPSDYYTCPVCLCQWAAGVNAKEPCIGYEHDDSTQPPRCIHCGHGEACHAKPPEAAPAIDKVTETEERLRTALQRITTCSDAPSDTTNSKDWNNGVREGVTWALRIAREALDDTCKPPDDIAPFAPGHS